MVMDDLEVPRWLKKPAIFPIFRHPNSPSWWMRIPRTREKSNGVKSRGKHRSIQLYNSYISINKQVTIRDINGVKLLKSVIILNLLHFWIFLLYLWFEILTTFLRGAISEAAEKWRRLRQPEAIPQNCDVKQRECNFFLLNFFSTFGDRQAETWQQGWAVSSEANIMALRAKTGARGHGATEST